MRATTIAALAAAAALALIVVFWVGRETVEQTANPPEEIAEPLGERQAEPTPPAAADEGSTDRNGADQRGAAESMDPAQ